MPTRTWLQENGYQKNPIGILKNDLGISIAIYNPILISFIIHQGGVKKSGK